MARKSDLRRDFPLKKAHRFATRLQRIFQTKGQMMKNLSTFEKATLATTGMASAVALMSGAAQAQDFDGFYMGASVSTMTGDLPIGDNFDEYALASEPTAGLFVGYNGTLGNGLVLGAELAFQGETDGDDLNNASCDCYAIKNVIDLKAKVGTTVTLGNSPVLLYGFAGLSTGTAALYYDQYSFNGYNYGVGADMMVGQNFSVGIEILGRTVDGYVDSGDPYQDTNHGQVSLRGAFRF
jgi:Outer membrane protein beta-barrel domain